LALKREFFSTNEVAQILGISPFTVRRYIQLRKLKAVKLEGSYRVRKANLEQFLKAREIETEDELAALGATEAKAVAPPEPKRPAKKTRAARPLSRKPKARAASRKEEE
jgi:excisionase family DNA binding protein